MKYRQLSNGVQISEITFGCWELGGGQWEKKDDEVNIQALQRAFELGIQSFDTAEGYGQGHSEELVGLALEGVRKECVIATKVSPSHLRRDDILRAAEQSLKRLRTDYIDIYYVHWPNHDIPLSETMSTFAELRDEGVIRSVAVSNFSRDLLEAAMSYTTVDCIQPEYSLLERRIEADVLPYCLDHGIGVLTYSSVAKGILTGAYHLDGVALSPNDFRQGRRLFKPEHLEAETPLVCCVKRIADRHGVKPAEVAIAWILQQPGITSAIVGTQNIAHLEENVRAVDLGLSEDELRELDDVSRSVLAHIDGPTENSR
ncbi:aldo/keto reductase [Alicyclobacillus mali]|uniref:Aldo/keto reductase n=1 Tax=Alicyclobacillus mali (ex Roth et al. 2021) TaxID=1123961 RepID=A0ABS0F6M3_9BACL|nr:aldo/keto reductase [Alicyclobacillus mali (ex Roth et al. 2021)]MBF8378944.1 aldo/keto reductase [Alicyclobacillus mali (ex Roth et al. 2021)]MCL6487335.1 aldo/keto reductase [Alicyclobacillus mali (ex Roth et al. 2021)]